MSIWAFKPNLGNPQAGAEGGGSEGEGGGGGVGGGTIPVRGVCGEGAHHCTSPTLLQMLENFSL